MAVGWAPDGAVDAQINDSIADEISNARRHIPSGESLRYCENCGDAISEKRRIAIPGVRLCIHCQKKADSNIQRHAIYNRKGSKDSQLK